MWRSSAARAGRVRGHRGARVHRVRDGPARGDARAPRASGGRGGEGRDRSGAELQPPLPARDRVRRALSSSSWPTAEIVKFTKDGSTVMTRRGQARPRLDRTRSRGALRRGPVLLLRRLVPRHDIDRAAARSPPPSPRACASPTVTPAALDAGCSTRHPGRIACIALEPARTEEPAPGYLAAVARAVRSRGRGARLRRRRSRGFRWHRHGAQAPLRRDARTSPASARRLANGLPRSRALAGRRELMELGGLEQTARERVFLLSTTHGAESVALGAGDGDDDDLPRRAGDSSTCTPRASGCALGSQEAARAGGGGGELHARRSPLRARLRHARRHRCAVAADALAVPAGAPAPRRPLRRACCRATRTAEAEDRAHDRGRRRGARRLPTRARRRPPSATSSDVRCDVVYRPYN